jgi:hypothetical protein
MPLPAHGDRRPLHLRRIEIAGYARPDGLYEIEAHLTDTKTTGFRIAATGRAVEDGATVHDMRVRMVVDDELVVHEVCASTDVSPYPVCPEAAGSLAAMVGDRISAGWSRRVKQKLGGRASCTHLMELLLPMATAAYQTIAPVRLNRPERLGLDGRPVRLDSCLAYAGDGEVARQRWPEHYTGPKRAPG